MLEVLYNTATLEVMAWNGDMSVTGNLIPGQEHAVVILPIDPPTIFSDWYKVDLATQQIYCNPDYDPRSPDQKRMAELIATSPAAITMPEIWELLRILARYHI